MIQFKIGSKVRLRDDLLIEEKYGGWRFFNYKKEPFSKGFGIIERANRDENDKILYQIKGDKEGWIYTSEMLLPFSEIDYEIEE